MEVTVLHGENEVASRKRYLELRRELKQKGPKDLFGEGDASSLLWYPTALSQTAIQKFPKGTKFEKFDLPKRLFSLLENIGSKNSLSLSREEPRELVFAMIARQIRDIYWVLADEKTLTYPSWRISKLKKQANFFTISRLRGLIKTLANLDLGVKTGKVDLPTAIDLVLAQSLK